MFQPASRARAIGSTDSRHDTCTTYSGEPATRASWIARFVAFRLGRPRQRVVLRLGLAGRQRLLHEHVDRIAVLRVDHHQCVRLGRDLHRAEERLVVDHQRALVGHEELVRRDALLGQRRELLERAAVLQVGDRHVVAHVDHLLAFGLRLPLVDRLAEGRALGLDDEVDVAGRPAERGRRLSRLDVVDRHRAAERHVEVRVRVDAARQHVLAARVDDAVRADVERLADQGDPLAFDVDVADIVVRGGDDAPALDQNRHRGSPFSVACSYLPPSVRRTTAFFQFLP
jgi:hypothetical protein